MKASVVNLPGVRRARNVALSATLLVFAAVIIFVTLQLRAGLREQILRREGETLAAVASLQLSSSAVSLAELGVSDSAVELLSAVLQASKLRGVVAIRVFDASRQFVGAVPAILSDDAPSENDWFELQHNRSVTRIKPRAALDELTSLPTQPATADAILPLQESWVPLASAENVKLVGAAQFWIDGRTLATEFTALDRRLTIQAALAWLSGAFLISLAIVWAFRQLADAHAALQMRTDDLQRANRELALAAKTSALGAVTAHLIHGLKNPIAGLELLLAGRSQSDATTNQGEEWLAANDLAARLRSMVDDVVAVLRDEESEVQFELSCAEILQLALEKARSAAQTKSVKLASEVTGSGMLSGRRANLALLVLQNLLQNAIEASANGGGVRLSARAKDFDVEFFVQDEGPGLPAAQRERLFQPCQSTKIGGSGLGLALSFQLARQAGGQLELIRSDSVGTIFRLHFSAGA